MQKTKRSGQKTRVGLIYLGRRGAGGWISFELAQQLQKGNPIMTVVSRDMQQQLPWGSLQTEQIFIHTYNNMIFAAISLMLPLRINALVQRIRLHKPDILLFTMFHPWNAQIQKRMQDIPSVVFVHDPRPHPDLPGWLYGKMEQVSLIKAERCVVLSENLVGDLLQRGIPSDRIDIVPLGLFRRSTSNLNLMPQKGNISRLLFFGRIVPYKGLEILLQAFAEIRKTHKIHLTIAGEGDIRPFRNLLDGLPDVKIINEWISEGEIENIFLQSDLLVLPYTSASQSGVIPIAASFGLPVIATRTGGIPEQIEDGVSGWLVQAGIRDSLISAIKDAVDHPHLARQRGAALQARYQNMFSWEKIGQKVQEILLKARQARGQR